MVTMGVSAVSEQVILQLGDLHFTGFKDATTNVDNHDRSTPGRLDSTLGLPIPTAIRRALVEQINKSPGAMIAICGDITTQGNREDFIGGVDFLADTLADPLLAVRPHEDHVHLVPGNHDVSFKGDQPFTSFEDISRFDVLADICRTAGLGILATSLRHTTITLPRGDAGLSVLSVNTSRGAGATRRDLPGGSDDALLDALVAEIGGSVDIHGILKKHAPESSAAEVLDVPLLHPEELHQIAGHWSALSTRYMPVLLAHHGLLPQHTPRLNPYTEMANAGQARKELTKLNRSVLYLHGHIHEHVVEVVDFPRAADVMPMHSRAIIVAAPELKVGFNKVSVVFDAKGSPLGVRVEKFRINPGEQTVSREPDLIEVSLARRPSLTANQRKVLEFAVARGSVMGIELAEHAAGLTPPLDRPGVESLVETLCWSGLLRRNSPPSTPFEDTGYLL
ncbi:MULTISPECIES: metallophosphoesterase family protein [unclassified Microbacterium]|uniref:metallophosphoesterase family protein n=1 Tax=unclassified Microbacterium TaxID=2609290 RepID=UPI00386A857C